MDQPMIGETITVPGFVDIHVHCREPSTNKSETFKQATRAAVENGNIAICDMPNNPGHETWTSRRVVEKQRIIDRDAAIPVGIWAGSQPDGRCDNIGELSRMANNCVGLKSYGAITTGNERDYSAEDFGEIHAEWHRVAPDKPIALHAGKYNLGGFIDMAQKLDHHLHVCHVNDPRDVEEIYKAKKLGIKITCGVCPHHLLKDSHDVLTEGWWARMKPPLATQPDSEKLMHQFSIERKIDILETDHAPHPEQNKWQAETNNPYGEEERDTCYGVPSLDVASALMLRQVVLGNISLDTYIQSTSHIPASIIGCQIAKNTSVTWKLDERRITERDMRVRAETSPFLGMLAVGRVQQVVISGTTVYDRGMHLTKAPRVLRGGEEI